MHPVAFDLETPLITHEQPFPEPVVVVVDDGSGPVLSTDVERTMRVWLEREDALLVGHYVAFDFGCLLTHCPSLRPLIWDAYEAGRVADTRLRELLIDIANGERRRDTLTLNGQKVGPYTLGRLAARRLNATLDKSTDSWRLRYAELRGVPLAEWPAAAVEYVEQDGAQTLALYRDQEQRRGSYTLPTQVLETRADFALALTSAWGMLVDEDSVDAFDLSVGSAKELLAERLSKVGLVVAKGAARDLFGDESPRVWKKDTKAIRAMVEASWHGRGELARTKSGLIKADEAVLYECDGEFPALLREYNTLESTGSRFLKSLRPLRGRATRARFSTLGADSSRTSCSGPNLQQLPRKPGARECFRARPGRVLLACDHDGQETRTWAQTCLDLVGHSAIADHFKRDPDYDAHTDLASQQLGIDYEEGMVLKGANDEPFLKVRQDVKPATFGFPVGMGPATFQVFARKQGVELTLRQCEDLRDVFFKARPEARPYLDCVSAIVGGAGYGTQVQPQSGFQRGGVGFTDCANGLFQTLAAHATKEGFWRVVRRCYDERLQSPLLGSRPVNFVHDDGTIETPEEALHEAGEAIVQEMEEGMRVWVKDVPAKASVVAMRVWSKKAKRVVDDHGRLMPCD